MSRRAVVAMSCAGLVAAGLPFVSGAGAAGLPAGYPTAGCFDFNDPSGDATALNANNPNSDPDLDILGVALQSTAKDLKAYIKVNKLADGPSMSTDGHRYTLSFVFNGHVFSAAGSSYSHGSGAIRDGLSQTGQAGHIVQLGVDTPPISVGTGITKLAGDRGYKSSGLTFTWDKANSWVVIDLPIADIEKYGGAKFTGKLQSVAAFSATDEYAVSSAADTTEQGNSSTYTGVWQVGANKCWPQPKPAAKPVVKKKPKKH
jgi:hypothetical protein